MKGRANNCIAFDEVIFITILKLAISYRNNIVLSFNTAWLATR